MFKLRNASKANSGDFLIGKLPVKPNDVSIMTLDELYGSLLTNGSIDFYTCYDYCIYAVQGDKGVKSTSANLRKVDIDWYRQHDKGVFMDEFVRLNRVTLFGGALCHIDRKDSGVYTLHYLRPDTLFNNHVYSSDNGKWHGDVSGTTCVAVIYRQ